MKKFYDSISIIISIIVLVFLHSLALGANYPLEITQPQPNLTTANRYYKTYTGFEYKVRVGVIGGLYPYIFSLTTAPSGMTIDAFTGIITWPNPVEADSPHRIIVSVTDSEGTTITRTWTLTVSTSGFYFMDAINGRTVANGGMGTLANPWKTLDDLIDAGSVTAGSQAYFKNGTYNLNNCAWLGGPGNAWYQVRPANTRPLVWLAYPGHSPVIDFLWRGSDMPLLRFDYADTYLSGFELKNGDSSILQLLGNRIVIAWNTFHDLLNAVDGENSAFIMTVSVGDPNRRQFTYIHNNEFHSVFGQGAFMKFYTENKSLIEENTLHNESGNNSDSVEGIALKAWNNRVTVRKNTIYSMYYPIGGNANYNGDNTIEFNLVRNCGSGAGIIVNHDGTIRAPEYYYRNTFVCPVSVRYVDTSSGPFTFTNNVIVNASTTYSGLSYVNVSAPSRILRVDDLTGTPTRGIVDATGALQGSYKTSYLGKRGYETGGESVPPAPPTELRLIP